MPYDSFKHHRRSIRLKGYDYSQPGPYFVTICAQNRECVFGEITNNKMVLTHLGDLVSKWWLDIPNHFPTVRIDKWIVMPNHLHGIIIIETNRRGEVPSPSPSPSPSPKLGNVIAYFKYQSTKEINQKRNVSGVPLWQRNYYEHIIRDDNDLNRIRKYIEDNPQNWANDENHLVNTKPRGPK